MSEPTLDIIKRLEIGAEIYLSVQQVKDEFGDGAAYKAMAEELNCKVDFVDDPDRGETHILRRCAAFLGMGRLPLGPLLIAYEVPFYGSRSPDS